MPTRKQLGWKAISYGAGGLAAFITQRLLEFAWKDFRHVAAPPAAADRRAAWADAVSWAVATGLGIGVTRLLAIRTAAVVWEAATREPPPEPALSSES